MNVQSSASPIKPNPSSNMTCSTVVRKRALRAEYGFDDLPAGTP